MSAQNADTVPMTDERLQAILQQIEERIHQYLPDTGENYYRGYCDALSWVEDLLNENEHG
jgi:arsenate reductase-like glutaredoxin family protein